MFCNQEAMNQARLFPFALRSAFRSAESWLEMPMKRIKWCKTTECHLMHQLLTLRRNEQCIKSRSLTWRNNCCKTAWMTYLNNGRRRAPSIAIERKLSRALEKSLVLPISKMKNKRAPILEIMVRSWTLIKCELVKPAPSSHSLKCTKKRVALHRLTAATAFTPKIIHSLIKGLLQ